MKTISVKIGRTLIIGIYVAILFPFFPAVVSAVPTAEISYVETNPVAGIWEYQYTVFNTSDPVDDAGVDLNGVRLTFPRATLTGFLLPTGWATDFISGLDFFLTYTPSFFSGTPSPDTDIVPGSSLSGFVLDFNSQAGNLAFDVSFLNPVPGESTPSYSGTTTASITPPVPEPGPVPVPEPATIILMTTGMGLLGLFGRKGMKKSRA